MKRLRSIVMAMLTVFVAVACVVPSGQTAYAASASLSIAPKKTYTVEPGKSVKDTLTIRNLDKEQTLSLTLRVVDFSYLDDGGTPKLMLAEDAPQTTWSLKPFLTVPKSVSIKPNSSTTLDMGVSIPVGHGAGSYYSAIVYSSGAAEGGNVGLSASGVTLVFASIPGQVNEDLKLEKFGPYRTATGKQEAGYMPFLTLQQPMTMAYTLKNNGNVTESPVGGIKLKHMFGKEWTISDINPSESLALRGQARTFTTCITQKAQQVDFNGSRSEAKTCAESGLWPGMYTATINLYYGQNGNQTNELSKTIVFWYIPLWLIIVLAVLLLGAAFYIWRFIKKRQNKPYSMRSKKTSQRGRR